MQKEELESYISKIENAMFGIGKVMNTVAEIRKDFRIPSIDETFMDEARYKLRNAMVSLEEVRKMRRLELDGSNETDW